MYKCDAITRDGETGSSSIGSYEEPRTVETFRQSSEINLNP